MTLARAVGAVTLASRLFAEDEPVFASLPGQIPGISGPLFGRSDGWPGDCVKRPANRARSGWKCWFPNDPVWNLHVREIAFCMLNPVHQAVRDAGIFLRSRRWGLSTVTQTGSQLGLLADWACTENLPDDLSLWSAQDWQAFLDHRAKDAEPGTVATAVAAIRRLVLFSPLMTGSGPVRDPWPGRTNREVADAVLTGELSTESIEPVVWWPLLRAAWTYIDRLAPDILDQHEDEARRVEAARDTVARACSRRTGQQPAKLLDEMLLAWLADQDNRIVVHGPGSPQGIPGEPVWRDLERRVYGNTTPSIKYFPARKGRPAGARRRAWARQAAADPTRVDHYEGRLPNALRMLRAACYVFVAAISMMRDSEIQEIQRGALTEHYDAPAVKSTKTKHDASRPRQFWWVIEPVAKAIAVAERVSWHETHIFASLSSTVSRRGQGGRAGFYAALDIDFFIHSVNATRHETGLAEIPAAHVRPHMFRKTMSIIASQEPDAEIALGIQLKHATRRALANRTTQAYGRIDTKWAKEFDTQLQTAAAQQLVALLKDRRAGKAIAGGPGAARFHEGLDTVNTVIDQDPVLRAQLADERLEVTLLRDEFANLHLGTINHCLWHAPSAQCQSQLPKQQRGQAPLLGACQPSRCRNSVLTLAHERIWRMEEADLLALLDKRLSKPLREQALARIAEVRMATAQFDKLKGIA
ncbi:hypothetical protein [Streptomyces formicae]